MIEIFLKEKKKSQVWVETAIYTLIGLTIMAIVLSIAIPQIEKARERGVIKQTIAALNDLNKEIQRVEQTAGTRKIVDFKISKGKLEINGDDDKITYTLENTKLEYSEKGKRLKIGDLFYETKEYGRRFNLIIELDYGPEEVTDPPSPPKLDIRYDNENKKRTLHGSALYKIQIENGGSDDVNLPTIIDFSVG